MKNTSEDINKKIASIIRKELKNEIYDDSCWLKAFSKADGDEQKAKVLYIELRTSDLKREKQKEKLIEDSKTHSHMRCGRSFCVSRYKILSIPKTSIGIQKCEGCGNMLEEKVSEKNVLDAIDNSRSEPISYSTKSNKINIKASSADITSLKNNIKSKAINFSESISSSLSKKTSLENENKKLREKLVETTEELVETQHHVVTPESWAGGAIGVVIYIIYKAMNDYGWHAGDVVGLFLLAFCPGALFIGKLFNFKKKK